MAATGDFFGAGSGIATFDAEVDAPGVGDRGDDGGGVGALLRDETAAVDTGVGRAIALVLSPAADKIAGVDIGVRARSTDMPVHASTALTNASANSMADAVRFSGSRTSA